MATVEGITIANPELKAVAFAGDGDAFGEGISHMIFAAKRNADITVIVHDNGVYGLTTGQYTPMSEKGFKGPSTPKGSVEEPLNPLSLMLEAGATFVARGYSGKIDHLAALMIQAVEHDGFSFIDVLQPCVSYHDTYKKYNKLVQILDRTPTDYQEALSLTRQKDRIPIGLIYETKKPVFHKSLYGDWNPVRKRLPRKERQDAVAKLLEPMQD